MTFALAMTLVVLFSSIVLLHQYWSGALAEDVGDGSAPLDLLPSTRDDRPARQVDTAA